jgi:hypothetical protein
VAQIVREQKVRDFVVNLLSPQMHKKRADSIASAVFGTMRSDRLGSSGIGTALAAATGGSAKHGIKQVDRLLGNERFEVESAFRAIVPWVVGSRSEIIVTMDWTEYARDGHSRIALNLVTTHGRATPLVWMTVEAKKLKDKRNDFEDEMLHLLHRVLPAGIKVTILADRGFGDQKLYRFLQDLGWDFVIRFRGTITVESPDGTRRRAKDWVYSNGQVLEIQDATVTCDRTLIGAFVAVKKAGMKEAWFLATSLKGCKEAVVELYGRRFTCEENFRDEKDDRFGLGFKETRVSSPERRDRFLVINALATIVLTLLGAAGEQCGLDRHLKASTVRRRVHSLFCQGRIYLRCFMNKHVEALRNLLWKLITQQPLQTETYGLI